MTGHVYHARGKAVPEHFICHVGNLNPHVFPIPLPVKGNNVSLPTCDSPNKIKNKKSGRSPPSEAERLLIRHNPPRGGGEEQLNNRIQ